MPETTSISLVIRGFDEAPDEVTKCLGIKPHETWRKGEFFQPGSKKINPFNGWVLRLVSGKPTGDLRFEDVLSDVLDRLEPYGSALEPYAERGLAELDVSTWMSVEFNVRLYISGPVLKRLGQMGIALNHDTFNEDFGPWDLLELEPE